jgi:hypothetical protein
MRWLFTMLGGIRVGALALALLVVLYLATTVVPAGHIGVQDFFGRSPIGSWRPGST